MGRHATIDLGVIAHMWENGMGIKEIMNDVKCSESTVRRALKDAGHDISATKKVIKIIEKKVPIYPEDIKRYREQLRIGSIVKLPSRDEKARCPEGGRYTVIAKYPTFFIAVRGIHERHELYVTMIINERERINV